MDAHAYETVRRCAGRGPPQNKKKINARGLATLVFFFDPTMLNLRLAQARPRLATTRLATTRVAAAADTPPPPPPSQPAFPPAALALGAAALGAALAFSLRPPGPTLADVAALSTPLDVARTAGRPAVVEFYTPYCDVCRSLAPDAASVAKSHASDLSYVLLNADNPKWAPEVAEWGVRGVPHFVFLGADGKARGAAVGRLPPGELAADVDALVAGTDLPLGRGREGGAGVGEVTPLRGKAAGAVAPRDHAPTPP